jgi:hypothetical protein
MKGKREKKRKEKKKTSIKRSISLVFRFAWRGDKQALTGVGRADDLPKKVRDDPRPRSKQTNVKENQPSSVLIRASHDRDECSLVGTRPISRQSLGARARMASASASSASKSTNVSSVLFRQSDSGAVSKEKVGREDPPHLPVRRRARSRPSSDVIDQESESSTRQFSVAAQCNVKINDTVVLGLLVQSSSIRK